MNYREVFITFPSRAGSSVSTASLSSTSVVDQSGPLVTGEVVYLLNRVRGLDEVTTWPDESQTHAVATESSTGVNGSFDLLLSPNTEQPLLSGVLSGTFDAPFCEAHGENP